jgi:hypothetical protein
MVPLVIIVASALLPDESILLMFGIDIALILADMFILKREKAV